MGLQRPHRPDGAHICFETLESYGTWYHDNAARHKELQHELLAEASQSYPEVASSIVLSLCYALVTGRSQLRKGTEEWTRESEKAGHMRVGSGNYANRTELRRHCRELLAKYTDDAQLEPEDERFAKELLENHSRATEKMKNMVRVTVAFNPAHNSRTFYVVRADGTKEDFSYLRCVQNVRTQEIIVQDVLVDTICQICSVNSASGRDVCKFLDSKFPQYYAVFVTPAYYRNFVRFMLRIGEKMPMLLDRLLSIVLQNLTRLDLAIGGNLKDDKSAPPDPEEAKDPDEVAYQGRYPKLLDGAMTVVFEFLQRRLTTDAHKDTQEDVLQCLIRNFMEEVMTTPRCRYVQFLAFYVAGLRPENTEGFLMCLLRRAYSHLESWHNRQMAFAYISSFCSRASFLTFKYNLQMLLYLSLFLREHLSFIEKRVNGGQLHLSPVVAYLSAANAVCYMLTFRGEELAQETDSEGVSALTYILYAPGDQGVMRKEAFTPILESPMGILHLIDPRVARRFCRVMRPLRPGLSQLLQPPSLNSDQSPLFDWRTNQAMPGVVYPFEPYGLAASHVFVKHLYRSWTDKCEERAQARAIDDSAFPEDSGDEELPWSADKKSDGGGSGAGGGPLGNRSPTVASSNREPSQIQIAGAAPAATATTGGFHGPKWASKARRRVSSCVSLPSDSEESPKSASESGDFIDETKDQERGFIPSVGPSPAFRPCAAPEIVDDLDPIDMEEAVNVNDDPFEDSANDSPGQGLSPGTSPVLRPRMVTCSPALMSVQDDLSDEDFDSLDFRLPQPAVAARAVLENNFNNDNVVNDDYDLGEPPAKRQHRRHGFDYEHRFP
eukprot:CAMPEP_0178393126 /NCGR_PEP_ID=MMETSP0689_2-20121128/12028_1 /TAXON_ID=160604 /ORGANISM="Amphidinium massartii, Strain CS-259" /LENGTH=834 /DNA_ID=CAMNT_0020013711 /DNA_START=22 /DNA_END=2523 /DNA_ORIENTATION=+